MLKILGNKLIDRDDTLVAVLDERLGDKMTAYARLFSLSAEMLELLDIVLAQWVKEYDAATESAEAFNRRNEPAGSYYGRDLSHTILPDWVRDGLRLIATVKGEDTKI